MSFLGQVAFVVHIPELYAKVLQECDRRGSVDLACI